MDKDLVSRVMREMGAKGGRARSARLTPEERKEFSRRAVEARKEKARKRREAEEALALVALATNKG